MTFADIAYQRLHNESLLTPAQSPEAIVRQLGAIQSQDVPGGVWGIGLRCNNVTSADIMQYYNQGKILRTHMLRPTWHFVAPEDIRWMLMLTSPRVQAFCKHYYNKLGLDQATLSSSLTVVRQALAGGVHLTRPQLKEAYTKAGIDVSGMQLNFLVMYAELEAVICSGTMQGKQHTYARLDEWVAPAPKLSYDEALTKLTERFFTSHGPATIKDFAWWSSLTMADIRKGIALAKLSSVDIEGATFYYSTLHKGPLRSPVVHLLPNFDEYLVGFKERRTSQLTKLDVAPTYDNMSAHIMTIDGQIVGGWKRKTGTKEMHVQFDMFKKLSPAEEKARVAEVKRLGRFLQMPIVHTD